ncbi:MAG: PRD domain-containing protein [Lachnospiraceae bacterium]|nr:PRD domain-containing protein [Lachnospiraceae bacterium]
MNMTTRIHQILNILLDSRGQSLTDQKIADQIGVSKRTVLREMDSISEVLREYGLVLDRKKGEGSRILGDEEARDKLRRFLDEQKPADPAEKEIRRNQLLLLLLGSKEPQKLYYYAQKLGVSEATISMDLEAVEPWIEECHMRILKKPGYGVSLEGSETNFRNALQRLISANVSNESVREFLRNGSNVVLQSLRQNNTDDNIYRLMNGEILSRVQTVMEQIESDHLRRLASEAYVGLIIHITIAVERILQGEVMETEEHISELFRLDDDTELAQTIAKGLEEEFEITISGQEVQNIMLHIKGAKIQYSNGVSEEQIDTEKLLGIIDAMIESYDPEIASELKYDEEFIHGLLMHLKPAIVRLQYQMNIHNPLLEEIRSEYPDIFARCKKVAEVIKKEFHTEVPDSEIGYLTMHFGAAEERIRDRKYTSRCVHIGVICASGFGLARLMMAKLSRELKNEDVQLIALGIDELTPYVTSRTDFFLSSLNIEGSKVDVVPISPLVTARDVEIIRMKIAEYAHMPAKTPETDFTRQLDEINYITAKIKGVLRRYRHTKLPEEMNLDEVLETLAEKITGNRMSSMVLYADFKKREKIMSQLFPELGFGLFHCKSRAVNECSILTATARSRTGFTDESMKHIKVIICMTMPDDDEVKENGKMLGEVSSALIDQDDFLPLIETGDTEEIRNRIQNILRHYFNGFLNHF